MNKSELIDRIAEKAVSQEMKDKFIGGKGFGLRLLWDATRNMVGASASVKSAAQGYATSGYSNR